MIKVYHNVKPNFVFAETRARDGTLHQFHHVANVGTDDLDEAYEKTNTIYGPWWENVGVEFLGSPDHGKDGARSTSVGDLLELKGEFYLVAGVGFKKVEGVLSESQLKGSNEARA